MCSNCETVLQRCYLLFEKQTFSVTAGEMFSKKFSSRVLPDFDSGEIFEIPNNTIYFGS